MAIDSQRHTRDALSGSGQSSGPTRREATRTSVETGTPTRARRRTACDLIQLGIAKRRKNEDDAAASSPAVSENTGSPACPRSSNSSLAASPESFGAHFGASVAAAKLQCSKEVLGRGLSRPLVTDETSFSSPSAKFANPDPNSRLRSFPASAEAFRPTPKPSG